MPDVSNRFATPRFRQTRRGLYVCGINWGGQDDDPVAAEVRARRSFFSDEKIPSYRYRRRIETWFGLWGYPLATNATEAGDFEYCISQTNWLSDRSRRSDHRANPRYLSERIEQFLAVVRARNPAVILLFGSCLGVAIELNSIPLQIQFGALGVARTKTFHQKFPFTLRFFEFERCTIVSLPHPTGAVGTTNAQVKKCRPWIDRAFARVGYRPARCQ